MSAETSRPVFHVVSSRLKNAFLSPSAASMVTKLGAKSASRFLLSDLFGLCDFLTL